MENKKQEPEELYKEYKELITEVKKVHKLKEGEVAKEEVVYVVPKLSRRADEILKELFGKHPDFIKNLPIGERTEIEEDYKYLPDSKKKS